MVITTLMRCKSSISKPSLYLQGSATTKIQTKIQKKNTTKIKTVLGFSYSSITWSASTLLYFKDCLGGAW